MDFLKGTIAVCIAIGLIMGISKSISLISFMASDSMAEN